jgi:hypothetical protein
LPPGKTVIQEYLLPWIIFFSTSVGDATSHIRKVCGDQIADNCKGIWDIGEDGEFSTCWRDLGLPGLWYTMGMLTFGSLDSMI